jgi:hypothetical protein
LPSLSASKGLLTRYSVSCGHSLRGCSLIAEIFADLLLLGRHPTQFLQAPEKLRS